MKKTVMLIMCGIFAFITVNAQQSEKIEFGNKENEDIYIDVKVPNCKLHVTKKSIDADKNTISVEIENLDKEHSLLIFNQQQSEKSLKKLKIYFDNDEFPKTEGNRKIDEDKIDKTRFETENGYREIGPNEKLKLSDLQIENGKNATRKVPLYIVKKVVKTILFFFKKNRKVIVKYCPVELNISIKEEIDEDFIRISRECDSLLNEIDQKTFVFCNNSRHQRQLKTEKDAFQKRIDDLKAEIKEIHEKQKNADILPDNKKWKQYNPVEERLNKVEFKEVECKETHISKPAHKCGYCSTTLDQVSREMERYVMKLDAGRETTDREFQEILKMWLACQNTQCPLGKQFSQNAEKRRKIERLYNRIVK